MTTDRSTKWPHFEHGHISLDREQIHLQKKRKWWFSEASLGHLRNLPGTPGPLHGPCLTSRDPKRIPQGPPGITKTVRKSQISRIVKKRQGLPLKLIDLGLTHHENVTISLDHWRKSNTHFTICHLGGAPPHVQLSGQSVSGQLEPACQSVV